MFRLVCHIKFGSSFNNLQICIMIHEKNIDKIMKKQIKTIIIALTLGTITSNAQSVMANGIAAVNTGSKSTTELTTFVNKKAKKVSKNNNDDIKKYTEIVNLFNSSTVAFYHLKDSDRKEFAVAAKSLSASLEGMRKSEAKIWAKKINLNQSVFEFIWSSKGLVSNEVEFVEIPSASPALTSL